MVVDLGFERGGDARMVLVGLDRSRALTSLEAHAVEMNLSCGMFLGLLAAALDAQGWSATLVWIIDGGDWPEGALVRPDMLPAECVPLAALRARPAQNGGGARLDALRSVVARRVTNRAPYRSSPVPAATYRRLEESGRWVPWTAHAPRPSLTFIDSPSRIADVGRFVGRHAGIDFAHRAAWNETYRYIRFADREMRLAEDGFPITQLFGPMSAIRRLFYRIALAPWMMRLLTPFGYPDRIARELGALVAATPALVAFTLDEPSFGAAAQVHAGAAVLDFWLLATEQGLALHPISVVLQHASLREQLQAEIGLRGRLVFLARMGEPTVTFPPAPRRPAERMRALVSAAGARPILPGRPVLRARKA